MVENSRMLSGKEFQTPRENVSPENILTTNASLDWLVQRIATQVVDLDVITLEISKSKLKKNQLSSQVGWFAEAYLDYITKRLAENTFWKTKITFDPIDTKKQTDTYQFIKNRKGNYIAQPKGTNTQFVEYDNLIEVEGLPVVWEVKTGLNNNKLDKVLTPARIQRLAAPLQEYYSDRQPFQMGYVVIANPKMIDPTNPQQENFKRRGGHIVSFGLTYEQMVQGVRQNLQRKKY